MRIIELYEYLDQIKLLKVLNIISKFKISKNNSYKENKLCL